MNRMLPIGLALALFATVEAAPCRAQSVNVNSGVRDRAGLFSAEVVRQANPALQAIEREDHWQVFIETIDSLDGQDARARAIADAKQRQVHGLMILISKNDHKIEVIPSRSAEKVFSKERARAIEEALRTAFRAKEFDKGLRDAVIAIQKDLAAAEPPKDGAVKAGVRDDARMFSTGAVEKADRALRTLQREARWQVLVETIDSLDGQKPQDRAIADARKRNLHGLIVLISKADHKLWVEPSHSAEVVFTKDRVRAITATLERSLKEGKFDEGLLAAVSEARKDAGVAPEPPDNGAVARAREEEMKADQGKPGPVAALTVPSEKTPRVMTEPPAATAPPARPPSPIPAPVPAPAPHHDGAPAPQKGISMIPVILVLLFVGFLFFLWLLSRAARRPQQPSYGNPPQGMAGQPQPYQPPVGPPAGYGPAPRPAAPPVGNPGYAPAGPPVGNPGYPQGGYGYGAPPPPQHAGGGFMSGALGGLGGAIVGNILYDKFGRPVHDQGAPPAGGVHHAGGVVPPVQPGGEPVPSETYDPNAGAGGDWGGGPEQAPPANDWGGATQEASGDAGAGGDWGGSDQGAPEAPAAPDDAGGDWGGGGGGDDGGGGGDWGGGDQGQGQGQEGSW